MTVEQFDNGYWYAVELKAFAKEIGIPSMSKLRKDEIEHLIKHFLRTGKIKRATRTNLSRTGVRDTARRLSLKSRIVNYTNDRETKDFVWQEALKIDPQLKKKSGASYRLNRWREQQIEKGVRLTYGDLVKQCVKLNQFKGKFPQAPSGRYINFLSDFLAGEKGANRERAIRAWKELKKLDVPKNYRAWKRHQRR